MKYFYTRVTTQYDGLEWSHPTTIKSRDAHTALKRINTFDFTHDDGTEVQYPIAEFDLKEITKEEYSLLRRFYI